MSINRSVWSEAFFLQQLPPPACTLNLSAPQHPAPSSTHRHSAHLLRTKFAFCSGCMAWGGTREAAGHEDDASSASAALPWLVTGSGQCFPICTLPGTHSLVCAKRSLLNFMVTQCVMAKTGNDKRLVKNCNCCFQDHFFLDSSFVQTTTVLCSPRGNGHFQ